MVKENINTQEFWDTCWSTDGVLSRQCEKQIMKLVEEDGLLVLDIGCGSGRTLRGLKKDKKAEVFGFDISQVAIAILEHYGISGLAGDVKDLDRVVGPFDVVICAHTLEHVDDDKKLIENIARLTTKYAIIAVPNDCIGPDECNEHLRKYNEESLRALLAPHFKKIETHNVGIHLILKCYA